MMSKTDNCSILIDGKYHRARVTLKQDVPVSVRVTEPLEMDDVGISVSARLLLRLKVEPVRLNPRKKWGRSGFSKKKFDVKFPSNKPIRFREPSKVEVHAFIASQSDHNPSELERYRDEFYVLTSSIPEITRRHQIIFGNRRIIRMITY